MLEELLIGLIVVTAALYSLWYLTPVSERLRLAQAIAKRCSQTRASALTPALQRAAAQPTGACAGCGARGKCPVGQSLGKAS